MIIFGLDGLESLTPILSFPTISAGETGLELILALTGREEACALAGLDYALGLVGRERSFGVPGWEMCCR